jgi:DNA invertase Pin-like site-specific DNA recombinase|tara:strand:- start:1674 stop:2366 length:693 start_codon:yes stop_codon:yes gene_type:complete
MHKKIVSILRVSTKEQTVENQKHQITRAFPDAEVDWFIEEGVSGKTPNAERPEFLAATKLARKLNVPLVVANLSRLGRDLAEVSTWYRDNVMSNKLELVSLDNQSLEPQNAGFFFTVQQMERIKISERTKAAHDRQKAEIKEKGYFISRAGKKVTSLGNPNQAASDAGNAVIKARADRFASKVLPVIKDQLGQGKTMKQIAQHLNDEGYQTARGGDWYASTVSNALKRVA